VAPQANVQIASIYQAPLPRCDALTALGEVLGYLPDVKRVPSFATFFRRAARALRPGGLFVFDLIVRDVRHPLHTRNFRTGPDWAVLAKSHEDPRRGRLTREITTFRRVGSRYRRGREVHRVRVPAQGEILRALRDAGFRVRTGRHYGRFPLAPHRVAFFARKA
jgi:SAM-dependent methyltransferase